MILSKAPIHLGSYAMLKNLSVIISITYFLIQSDFAFAINGKRDISGETGLSKPSREERRALVTAKAALTSFVTTFMVTQMGGNAGKIFAVAAMAINIKLWQKEALMARYVYLGKTLASFKKFDDDIMKNTIFLTAVGAFACLVSDFNGVTISLSSTLLTTFATYFGINWEGW